jgi:hypothetical protein
MARTSFNQMMIPERMTTAAGALGPPGCPGDSPAMPTTEGIRSEDGEFEGVSFKVVDSSSALDVASLA